MNRLEDLFLRDGFLEAPSVYVTNIHVFDEPHFEAILSRKVHQIDDLVVVCAADDHRIDLDWRQAGFFGGKRPFRTSSRLPRFVSAVNRS